VAARRGLRSAARLAEVDRKTVRRYVQAAVACGLDACGGEGQLGDELLSLVAERVRPHRADAHGRSWELLAAHHQQVYTRHIRDLTADRTRYWQRLEKLLEDALCKLPAMASRLAGHQTARAIVEAMIAGERDPRALAALGPGEDAERGAPRARRGAVGHAVRPAARACRRVPAARHRPAGRRAQGVARAGN
jgi:hypothetical protein